jgi:hypothetical protein
VSAGPAADALLEGQRLHQRIDGCRLDDRRQVETYGRCKAVLQVLAECRIERRQPDIWQRCATSRTAARRSSSLSRSSGWPSSSTDIKPAHPVLELQEAFQVLEGRHRQTMRLFDHQQMLHPHPAAGREGLMQLAKNALPGAALGRFAAGDCMQHRFRDVVTTQAVSCLLVAILHAPARRGRSATGRHFQA